MPKETSVVPTNESGLALDPPTPSLGPLKFLAMLRHEPSGNR